MLTKIVDVKFYNSSKSYTFSCGDMFINNMTNVIVHTSRGEEYGLVIKGTYEVDATTLEYELSPVIRIADKADENKFAEIKTKEKKITKETIELAKKQNLDIKILNTEITFDENKITVNFSSENRVDFRELVKIMGAKYKSRIELRQVGARDEVKILGALGPCGKVCCCKEFLTDYEHVSIKMPKIQGISLSPTKINGCCNRLMCCLAYENNYYSEAFKQMPRVGSDVETPEGKGKVAYNNLLKKLVQVKIDNGNGNLETKEFPLEKIKFANRNSMVDVEDIGGNNARN